MDPKNYIGGSIGGAPAPQEPFSVILDREIGNLSEILSSLRAMTERVYGANQTVPAVGASTINEVPTSLSDKFDELQRICKRVGDLTSRLSIAL